MNTIFVLLLFFAGSPYQPEIYPVRYPDMETCQAASHTVRALPGDPNKGRMITFHQCIEFPSEERWTDIKSFVDQQLRNKERADCNMQGVEAGYDQAAVMEACTDAIGSD